MDITVKVSIHSVVVLIDHNFQHCGVQFALNTEQSASSKLLFTGFCDGGNSRNGIKPVHISDPRLPHYYSPFYRITV